MSLQVLLMSHTLRHSQKTYFLSVTYQSAVFPGSFCISELRLSQKILSEKIFPKHTFLKTKRHTCGTYTVPQICLKSFISAAASRSPAPRPRTSRASPAQFVLLISHSVECNAVQRELTLHISDSQNSIT